MKQLKNKLKSESGVSILFSLLLMLVVAMVSVVMVNASLTAVKRTSAKKDNQQVSISLDSAALLMRDKIKNDVGYTLTKKAVTQENGNVVYELDDSYNDNPFQPEIKKISEAYMNDLLQDCRGEFQVITTVESEKDDSVNVNYNAVKTETGSCRVVFTLSEDDSQLFVIFNLSLKDVDQTNPKVIWQYGGSSLDGGQ